MPDTPALSTLSARELILTLIDSASSTTLNASYFVAAGELFSIEPGNTRVALRRLVKDGSLQQVNRGDYSLASRSGTLRRLVRNWMKVGSQLKPWRGGYLTVATVHLPKQDKTRKRGRERALRLFGLAEALPGLWVRPDNLVDDTTTIRSSLVELGLDDNAIVATLDNIEPANSINPDLLWDRALLEARYLDHISTLSTSTGKLASLSATEAAVETLAIGRAVTRDILLDPLLPDELVDTGLRAQMITDMRAYDKQGKKFWRDLYRRYH